MQIKQKSKSKQNNKQKDNNYHQYNNPDKTTHKFTTDTTNLILNDLKNLSTALKPLNKIFYQENNNLINKLLTIEDVSLMKFIDDLTFHIFMVGQVLSQNKLFSLHCLLNIIGKIITLCNLFVERGFVYTFQENLKENQLQEKSQKLQQKKILQKMQVQNAKPKIKQQQKQKIKSQSKKLIKNQNNSLTITLSQIIDLLNFLKTIKIIQNMELRVIQTSFSLINKSFMSFMNYDLIVKLYNICFDCCLSSNINGPTKIQIITQKAMVQNISISALSALTQMIFAFGFNHFQYERKDAQNQFYILEILLEYMLQNKKFLWINDNGLKGVVWDLIIIAIRNIRKNVLIEICSQETQKKYKNLLRLIRLMYKISAQYSFFNKKGLTTSSSSAVNQNDIKDLFEKSTTMIDQKNSKNMNLKQKSSISINFKKGGISDFVRFYKAFIYFSINLWIRPIQNYLSPIISFHDYLNLNQTVFYKIYESEEIRSIKLYLLIEGIYLLLIAKNDLPLIEQKGYMLLQILCKVSQQICLSLGMTPESQSIQQKEALDVKWWDVTDIFLDKICGDFNSLSDRDFVRLIRTTIIKLRKKFQQNKIDKNTEILLNLRQISYEQKSQDRISLGNQSILNQRNQNNVVKENNQDISNYQRRRSQNRMSQNSISTSFISQMNNSMNSNNFQNIKRQKIIRNRWQKMIKSIVRIIRYLSSLNYKLSSIQQNQHSNTYALGNQQQPSRKLLIQLQHWFLITPYSRAKNLILHQLCVTSSFVQTKIQSIKSSQCAQIGTNLIYGYYDKIDSTGLAYLLKMISGIKVDHQQGKGYQQLDQVSRMAKQLFKKDQSYQNNRNKKQSKNKRQSKSLQVINDGKSFTKTIQGFVQSVSTLIADVQQPRDFDLNNNKGNDQKLNSRYLKMINFLIEKFTMIVTQYQQFLGGKDWSFISAFFITLCSNKHQPIQTHGIKYLGQIFKHFLKDKRNQHSNQNQNLKMNKNDSNKSIQLSPPNSKITIEEINQQEIMNIYLQLAKCHIKNQIFIDILTQLKQNLFLITSQQALMKAFHIVKDLYEKQTQNNHKSKNKFNSINLTPEILEMQEVLIKDCLYKITKIQYLNQIITQFGHISIFTDKNMQYNLVTLIWAIADHFKKLFIYIEQQNQQNLKEQYEKLWTLLFDRLLKMSMKCQQPQFRQSAFHAVTQILAQNSNVLGKDLLLNFMNKNYLSMLFLLLDIPPNQFQNSRRIQMIKFGVKNFVKLLRKLVKDQVYIENNKQFLGNKIIFRIQQYLSTYDNKDVLTVEYLYEICIMIELLLEEPIGIVMLNKKTMEDLHESISQKMKTLDAGSLHFRRKLQPLHQQLKQKIFNPPQKPKQQEIKELTENQIKKQQDKSSQQQQHKEQANKN